MIQKMTKRQIIMLSIMAVAVVYGAFNFFAGGAGKKPVSTPEQKPAELTALTANVTTAISQDVLSAGEAYAIVRAEVEWLHDPFYESKAYRELLQYKEKMAARAKAGDKKITFNYTGYMEHKGTKMAIINGVEYVVGESLEIPGYVLIAITPGKVTIGNKAEREKTEVPIEE